MTCHHIHLLPISSFYWMTNYVSVHLPHIPHSVHLLHIYVIKLLNILPYFRFRQSLICFKHQNVVVNFLPRSVENHLFLKKFIFWVFFGKIFVFRNLSWELNTSKPKGFRKYYLCSVGFDNIFLAFLGIKLVIIKLTNITMI